MTEIRRGRAEQGTIISGARALKGRVTGALDRLGQIVNENVSGNRDREQQARSDRQQRERTTGRAAARQYIGGGENEAVARTADRVESARRNRLPQIRNGGEAQQFVLEARASDARVRNASVSERNPRGFGAELTRGQGAGRRGVMERPFTVDVEGVQVEISSEQRATLAEHVRKHPRAFATFADWFNAISTLDQVRPEQLTAEQVAAARRVWTQPEQRPAVDAQGRELEIETMVDERTGQVIGYRETGALRQNSARAGAGSGSEGASTFEPPSAPYSPEELSTAQSDLMRITQGNMQRAQAGRSRTIARTAPAPESRGDPILTLPVAAVREIIAQSRLSGDVAQIQRETAALRREIPRGDHPTRPERDSKAMEKRDGDKPGGSKQSQRGTLIPSRDIALEQQAQGRALREGDGVNMEDPVDPFTRERVLPPVPPEEANRGRSRTLTERLERVGRVSVGGVELEPDDNGIRGRVRW